MLLTAPTEAKRYAALERKKAKEGRTGGKKNMKDDMRLKGGLGAERELQRKARYVKDSIANLITGPPRNGQCKN